LTAILHLVSLLDPKDRVAEHNYRASMVKITVGAEPQPSKKRPAAGS